MNEATIPNDKLTCDCAEDQRNGEAIDWPSYARVRAVWHSANTGAT
jgi:hypothetical protein